MDTKLVYSVPELASVLGVSRTTAYQLVRTAGFPAVKVSANRTVVPRAALDRWFEQQIENQKEV